MGAPKNEFDAKYKELRNLLRDYEKQKAIEYILLMLKSVDGIPVYGLKDSPIPWITIDLLRIAIEFLGENKANKAFDKHVFNRCYNLAMELEGAYYSGIMKDGVSSFMLMVAHKQFIYQRAIGLGYLARMKHIFLDNVDMQHGGWFFNSYAMSMKSFVGMCIVVYAEMDGNKSLAVDLKKQFKAHGFDGGEIDAFLGVMSVDILDVSEWIKGRELAVKSYFLRFGEEPPFVSRPILNTAKDGYCVLNGKLLERALQTFIFEAVKRTGDEGLIMSLANGFESYVGSLLVSVLEGVINESSVQEKYDGKSVDYVVECEDSVIFFEVKSVRLPEFCKANPEPEIITSALSDNVIKAYLQGFELGKAMFDSGIKKNFFMIVVCYDDMYLGNPTTVWEQYVRTEIGKDFSDDYLDANLSPDSVFVVGINDLEYILSAIKNTRDLVDLLVLACGNNKDPKTTQYTLAMAVAHETRIANKFIDESIEGLKDVFLKEKNAPC